MTFCNENAGIMKSCKTCIFCAEIEIYAAKLRRIWKKCSPRINMRTLADYALNYAIAFFWRDCLRAAALSSSKHVLQWYTAPHLFFSCTGGQFLQIAPLKSYQLIADITLYWLIWYVSADNLQQTKPYKWKLSNLGQFIWPDYEDEPQIIKYPWTMVFFFIS